MEHLKLADSTLLKKPIVSVIDKENITPPSSSPIMDMFPPILEHPAKEKLPVAPMIKEDEIDEPLLKENPHRFVLFPIKYNDVSLPGCDSSSSSCKQY